MERDRHLRSGSRRTLGSGAARLSRTRSSYSRRPIRRPSFDLGTVVTLSTAIRQDPRSPLRSFGSIGRRKSGASVGSVVSAQTVIDPVASNRSSWRNNRAWLAGVLRAARGGPDLAPFHSSPQTCSFSQTANSDLDGGSRSYPSRCR